MRPTTLCFALALAGCRHASPAPEAAADSPRTSAPSRADAAAVGRDAVADAGETPLSRRLSALADQLASRMSTVRELSIVRPIARGVMSREDIVARLRARTREEYPPGELELEGEGLKRLGLIPQGMNYERTMFDLLEEQVLGFYDPNERRLFLADWVPAEMQAPTMAHEIVHALQDQHFDIARYTHHVRGRGDVQTSAMSVLEGDATAAMLDFSLSDSGRTVLDIPDIGNTIESQSSQQPRMAAAPRALRESLMFPYIAGLRLCIERMRAGGHAAVDALLARPPDSTEQVLHPDKLASRELPVEVSAEVPPALAGEFEVAWHDVLGEFGVRLVLEEGVSDARAALGARGWGGDRAMLLVPRGSLTPDGDAGVRFTDGALSESALVWSVTMDAGRPRDEGEAAELTAMLSTVLARRYADRPAVTVAGASASRAVSDGRVSLVATRGRRVLFADRVPSARAAELIRSVLAP